MKTKVVGVVYAGVNGNVNGRWLGKGYGQGRPHLWKGIGNKDSTSVFTRQMLIVGAVKAEQTYSPDKNG